MEVNVIELVVMALLILTGMFLIFRSLAHGDMVRSGGRHREKAGRNHAI
jgi:ABC-type nickel/cobalt efflux system permease component RcnA